MFEDFVPISDREALITTGPKLDALNRIELVSYKVHEDGGVQHAQRGKVVAQGSRVRLGGMLGGKLYYSEHNAGVFSEGRNVDLPETAHQPFVYEGSVYYTDEWPYVKIHKDGALYLDHFGPMVQVSNPCWVGDIMYFECRDTVAPDRPDAWQIWSHDRTCGCPPRFVVKGANPAYFDGRLFFGEWQGHEFAYRSMVL